MRAHRAALALALCACGGPETGDLDGGRDGGLPPIDASLDAGPPRPLSRDDFSAPALAAIDALETGFPGERGRAWDYFGDATFDPGFVLQTPPREHWGAPLASLDVATCASGCDPDFGLAPCTTQSDCATGTCRPVGATVAMPGDTPRSLCVGHSDALYDEYHAALIATEDRADVTSLSPPDGRFEAALRNALTYLSYTGRPIRVRLLFGNIVVAPVDTDAVLASLVRDLDPSTPMTISVGAYRVGVDSWNHSKIVAVDGEILVEGGHNFWTDHYLTTSPVHDISLRMRGSVAIAAHRFANPLWAYVCEGHTVTGYTGLSTFPAAATPCPDVYDAVPPDPALATGARVIAVGRYGGLGANPSDAARIAMFDAAVREIDLSLQDIGPVRAAGISLGDWPDDVLGALGRAIARGVDVRVVLSTAGSTPGGLGGSTASYGNGWTAEDAARAVLMWLEANPSFVPAGTTARDVVCERFHATTLRASGDDAWPDGATLGNHAKLFIVDDLAAYVGSHNLYPADLAELGVIVDDVSAVQTLRDEYWDPLWEQSRRVAVSGSDAPSCAL